MRATLHATLTFVLAIMGSAFFAPQSGIAKGKNIKKTFNVTLGRGFRDGPYYQVKASLFSCKEQKTPVIVIVKKPKIGTVKIIKKKVTPRQTGCKRTKVNGVGIQYQSHKTGGRDLLVYEVRYGKGNLGTWRFTYNITVK